MEAPSGLCQKRLRSENSEDIPAINILEMSPSTSAGVAGQVSATELEGVAWPREMRDSTLAEECRVATWAIWELTYFPSVKTMWEKFAGRKTWRVSVRRGESGTATSVDEDAVKRVLKKSDTGGLVRWDGIHVVPG